MRRAIRSRPLTPPPSDDAVEVLYVRESAVYSYQLFLQMLIQTISKFAETSDVYRRILDLGISVITDERVQAEIGVERLDSRGMPIGRKRRRVTAYRFRIGNVICLYSMTSAAKRDEVTRDNPITRILIETIYTYKPWRVLGSSVSRFVRATTEQGNIEAALKENGTLLWTVEGGEWDLHDEGHHMMWTFLGLVADQERKRILFRTTLGQIIGLMSGRWSLSRERLPLGWMLEGRQPKVSDDPAVLGWTRALIEAAANHENSDEDIAQLMNKAGFTSPRLRSSAGEEATLLDAASPLSMIRARLRRMSTYQTGRVVERISLPLGGFQHVGGFEVRYDDPKRPDGYVEVEFELPQPPEGWADAETLAAAAARPVHVVQASTAPSGRAIPFAGVTFDIDGRPAVLDPNTSDYLMVRYFEEGR